MLACNMLASLSMLSFIILCIYAKEDLPLAISMDLVTQSSD